MLGATLVGLAIVRQRITHFLTDCIVFDIFVVHFAQLKPPSMLISKMTQAKRMSRGVCTHSTASCFVILYILCLLKDFYLHPSISHGAHFSTSMRSVRQSLNGFNLQFACHECFEAPRHDINKKGTRAE